MAGAETEGRDPISITAGPTCNLAPEGETSHFEGSLAGKSVKAGTQILFFYQIGNNRNYYTELVTGNVSHDEVEQLFANCPCHKPENAGKGLGSAGCLVLKALKINEEE